MEMTTEERLRSMVGETVRVRAYCKPAGFMACVQGPLEMGVFEGMGPSPICRVQGGKSLMVFPVAGVKAIANRDSLITLHQLE